MRIEKRNTHGRLISCVDLELIKQYERYGLYQVYKIKER